MSLGERRKGGRGAARQVRRPAGVRAVGFLFLGLGLVGALLPLMPTTVFLIMAAACFARSSLRMEAWLIRHPRSGPTLTAWRTGGAIPRKAKALAILGMSLGGAVFVATVHPSVRLATAAASALLLCRLWIISLPAAAKR